MVYRRSSGVRVSAGLAWLWMVVVGFGVPRCDRASQADGADVVVAVTVRGSPVKAALGFVDWERRCGSSARAKRQNNKRFVFLFALWLCFLCWRAQMSAVPAILAQSHLWELVLLSAADVATDPHTDTSENSIVRREVLPLTHNVLGWKRSMLTESKYPSRSQNHTNIKQQAAHAPLSEEHLDSTTNDNHKEEKKKKAHKH